MGVQTFGDPKKVSLYYGSDDPNTTDEADFPFNYQFDFLSPQNVTGFNVYHLVNEWMTHMPKGKWPNWVVCFWLLYISFRNPRFAPPSPV